MNKLVSIVLWTIGVIFFLVSFIILSVCLLTLPKPRTFAIARKFFAIQIRLMGIRLVVNGIENIDPDKTYLMMGNHQSLFDIFVIPAAIPLCFTGVEAAYHFSIPIWGYLIRKWGCIPIQRSNLNSAINSLKLARQTIASGLSICILPEGHRTLNGKMGKFKKGPFHLARDAKADLLLFGINGLFRYQPKGRFELRPGLVEVNIAPIIAYETIKDMDIDTLKSFCFEKIKVLSRETNKSNKRLNTI